MKKTPLMLLAIALILLGIPALGVGGVVLLNRLYSRGFTINENYSGGKLVGSWEDMKDDLAPLPAGLPSNAPGSLDVVRFTARTQEFTPWAGLGMEPRLNLIFDFKGTLVNEAMSSVGFSLPVIRVEMEGPAAGERLTVIMDGFHNQARIYRADGSYAAEGIDLYVDDTNIEKGPNQKPVVSGDRVVASLPLAVFPRGAAWTCSWDVELPGTGILTGDTTPGAPVDQADAVISLPAF